MPKARHGRAQARQNAEPLRPVEMSRDALLQPRPPRGWVAASPSPLVLCPSRHVIR